MEKIIINSKNDINDYRDLRDLKVDIKSYPIRIEDFITAKRFNIQPYFQREYVWNDQKASALIETILLSLPIPSIYTYIDFATGEEPIIDGQQRLMTIKRFLKNGFKLQSMKKLKFLENLYFYQLDDELKMRLLTFDLNIICLKNISNNIIIFDLFERFNTGGMKLNSQEIRNCIYNGQYNDYIKKQLINNNDFNKLLEKFNPKRFLHEELAVRFLALYNDLNLYKGNMKTFLNKHYEDRLYLNDFSQIDFRNYIREYEKTFNDCISACDIVFGQNAFRKIIKYDTPFEGKMFGYGSFSKLVFDMQMMGFADKDLVYIRRHAEKIKEKYIEVILNNPDMEPNSDNNNKLTAQRIKRWQDYIGKIIHE